MARFLEKAGTRREREEAFRPIAFRAKMLIVLFEAMESERHFQLSLERWSEQSWRKFRCFESLMLMDKLSIRGAVFSPSREMRFLRSFNSAIFFCLLSLFPFL